MGDGDRHLWPTRGIIDWSGFAAALKETRFDGVFSLETSADGKLCDEEFEKETLELFKLAENIVKQI